MTTLDSTKIAAHNLVFTRSGGDVMLTITPDGRIEIGPGLSMEEATQQAAKMLAAEYEKLVRRDR